MITGISPMMQQYINIKNKYKDCIVFFRLGDFYEMFFDDAETASKELEITLTGRNCGMENRAPMCGVPFHSAESYISKLITKGYKVAICEQVQDSEQAKGIVERDVVRVITPGTVTETSMLDEKKNNYLMAIYKKNFCFGISVIDISTGELKCTQIEHGNTFGKLMDEAGKYLPSEIIVNSDFLKDEVLKNKISEKFNFYLSSFEDKFFETNVCEATIKNQFDNISLDKNLKYSLYINSLGALLEYLKQTQKVDLKHVKEINIYKIEDYMVIDVSTRRNLELTETIRDNSKKGSLLWVVDKTMTSMGGRTIRKWIEEPLININDINERLFSVNELKDKFMIRSEIRELLKRVYDIERLMGKFIIGNINGRDMIALKKSIGQVPYIKDLLQKCESSLLKKNNIRMDSLQDIYMLVEGSISDEAPVTIKEGNIIKTGYNNEVDKHRSAATEGRKWIAELESTERERTGIKNLKVGFNKVFGYYIEITKSNYSLVPENYIRKQTLANCERYITPELKDIEDTILGAHDKLNELEYNIFNDIKDKIVSHIDRIKQTALSLSEIDVLSSLAEVADRESYCMPEMSNDSDIEIIDGRHPVVEKMIEQGCFIPNNVFLDMEENRVSIITGPNMAGKSTYMRQIALIVLMSQVGSFVPAKTAKIGVADRIFTRVGASDDLASGQSTFMVEMMEVANILKNASSRSLLILDEIGRGTSTFDGLSIAWSVIEYICDRNKLGCRTLFATHYHELTELEGKIRGIKNYCISVKEEGEDITFLRKIIRGGADGSYGVHVARLAGIPKCVIDRAKEILFELEDADISKKEIKRKINKMPINGQVDLFSIDNYSMNHDPLLEELKNLEISNLTPIEALNFLSDLQKKINEL